MSDADKGICDEHEWFRGAQRVTNEPCPWCRIDELSSDHRIDEVTLAGRLIGALSRGQWLDIGRMADETSVSRLTECLAARIYLSKVSARTMPKATPPPTTEARLAQLERQVQHILERSGL